MTIRFTVPGDPQGKGRPRFSRETCRAVTPQKTVNYETLVKWCYQTSCGRLKFEPGIPLDMRVFAYLGIPASAPKKKQELMRQNILRPTKKPDFDNIGKITADALNGLAYHDDAQVVDSMIRKFYSDNPRVEILITEVSHE